MFLAISNLVSGLTMYANKHMSSNKVTMLLEVMNSEEEPRMLSKKFSMILLTNKMISLLMLILMMNLRMMILFGNYKKTRSQKLYCFIWWSNKHFYHMFMMSKT